MGVSSYNAAGGLFSAGTCTLIRNNETDGAWVLTASHACTDHDTSSTFYTLKYGFGTNAFTGLSEAITANSEKVFYHPIQDIALIKLQNLVYEIDGTLTTPIAFYSGTLTLDIPLLFGGYGQIGTPEQADPHGTGYRDGNARVARGWLWNFGLAGLRPSLGYMEYHSDLVIAGIGSNGDSGGFTAIEQGGEILLVGLIDEGRGNGTDADTGFERLDYDPNFSSWMNDIIAANGNPANNPPVANAGLDQSKAIGQVVALDGSGSSDPDGDPLTYEWEILSEPSGAGATLSNPAAVSPTFTADEPGTYVVQLAVSDGLHVSADTVQIVVTQAQHVPGPSALLVGIVFLIVGCFTIPKKETRWLRTFKRNCSYDSRLTKASLSA
jgi:hypothetical protein